MNGANYTIREHAEQRVLGGLMKLISANEEDSVSKQFLEKIKNVLHENLFSEPYRTIYQTIVQMQQDQERVDPIEVATRLLKQGKLDTNNIGTLFGQIMSNTIEFGTVDLSKQIDFLVAEVDSLWEQQLEFTKLGKVKQHKTNILTILTFDPNWRDVLGFNEFNYQIVKRRTPPYFNGNPIFNADNWTDTDNELLSIWFQRNYGFEPASERLQPLIATAAQENPYHPIREYLELCHQKWQEQGKPELANCWAEIHLGAEPTDVNRLFQQAWLLSAVARVFQPGTKVDNILILEGAQGLGKSTVLKILGGEWFSDNPIDFNGGADVLMIVHDNWIIEMPELDKFKRATAEQAIAFFGITHDKYRVPYGRNLTVKPRQCVFAGTTNTNDYLKDSTGNRRYMPIRCLKRCDFEQFQQQRDLIWGHAVELYKSGYPHWIDDSLKIVIDAQQQRVAEDPWLETVSDYLDHRAAITITQILIDCLQFDLNRCDRNHRNRVANILRQLKWTSSEHLLINGKRCRGWKCPAK